MEDGFVGIGLVLCPVCMDEVDSEVIISRRINKKIPHKSILGWRMCQTHQQKCDEGYIHLVELAREPENTGDFASWQRTGTVVSVRKSVADQIFNLKIEHTIYPAHRDTIRKIMEMTNGKIQEYS